MRQGEYWQVGRRYVRTDQDRSFVSPRSAAAARPAGIDGGRNEASRAGWLAGKSKGNSLTRRRKIQVVSTALLPRLRGYGIGTTAMFEGTLVTPEASTLSTM
jgi:hypothetical protein